MRTEYPTTQELDSKIDEIFDKVGDIVILSRELDYFIEHGYMRRGVDETSAATIKHLINFCNGSIELEYVSDQFAHLAEAEQIACGEKEEKEKNPYKELKTLPDYDAIADAVRHGVLSLSSKRVYEVCEVEDLEELEEIFRKLEEIIIFCREQEERERQEESNEAARAREVETRSQHVSKNYPEF